MFKLFFSTPFLLGLWFQTYAQAPIGIKNKKPSSSPVESKTNIALNAQKTDTSLNAVKNGSVNSKVKLIPPDKLTREYTDALKQVLNLSNAQYDKMLQVNRALIDKIDALVYSSKDYSSFLLGLKLADKMRMDKYKVFLTPIQLKTYVQDSTLSGLNKVSLKSQGEPGIPVMK
jgi:hypothetical protein